jgi:outer membrane lipoprotein-sorting protein
MTARIWPALLLTLFLATPAWAITGREVMQLVEDRDTGENVVSRMTMELINKRGKKRIRKLRSFRKDREEDALSLIFFEEPADVRNTGFLTYDYDEEDKDDDQWMYLPALKKTKRIAGSDKAGSFMGSDFNYSDISGRDLADFTFKLLKEGKVGVAPVWIVLSTPKSKEVMEETGYQKSVLWVRQDNHVVIRGKSWVHKSKEIKFFEVKDLEKIGGIWFALTTTVTRKLGKKVLHRTILTYSDIRLDQELDDDLFTQRRLEKGL